MMSYRKRNLTEFEELVIRTCHHEFSGLSQTDAAKLLKVSPSKVSRALKAAREKAPSMFPIFTKEQYDVYLCYAEHGLPMTETANHLNITEGAVKHRLERIRQKGTSIPSPVKTVPYKDYMDDQVRQKF